MLLDDDGREEGIQFISIVGMAGIGKTAVARLVYSHDRVVESFHRAWVSISYKFNTRRIANSIIQCLTSKPVSDDDMEVLVYKFRKIVREKKCLFVLDDVWYQDSVSWLDLKEVLFSFCYPGSKVLITTRDIAVAQSVSTKIVELKGLTTEHCWSMIRSLAFGTSSPNERDVEMFNEVGRAVAKKCDGVPLTAIYLGKSLRGRSLREWESVLASNVWKKDLSSLMSSYSAMHLGPSLMLSYSAMPPALRQCLLYCSIIPKDQPVDVDKLIKLWMAQGFIDSHEDEMETEGRRYVKQLLRRSIFQEFKRDGNGNFSCKLESGMSGFIQDLARNDSHIMLPGYENKPVGNLRHCTTSQSSLPESIPYAKKLHTLMILSEGSSADPTNLAGLLSHMKMARALDLSSCSIEELPLKVGKLLYLRYLDLSFNRDLKKLPKAICNLLNLQTLNLNGCDSLRKLPKDIGRLIKLRHLEILWTASLSYLPKGIASLTSLRTLSRFFGGYGASSKVCNLGDLEKLNYIQGCITIDWLGDELYVSNAAKAGLKNKEGLLGLELWFSAVGSESNDKGVLEALEAPPQLQGLGIFYYRGESFPNWITALENLTHLMLSDCSKCSILPPLGKLPSLESLKIKNMSSVMKVGSEFLGIGSNNADDGEEGSSSTVAFPNLQNLCFQRLDDWEEWAEINGNGEHTNIMPSLSSLSIVDCPKLRAVPDYIKCEAKVEPRHQKMSFARRNSEDQ